MKQELSRVQICTHFRERLLFGLLPCGPVYTALLGAARVGMETTNMFQGIFTGIGLMAAFGLGTIPALLLVAKIADWGIGKYQQAILAFTLS